MFLEYDLLLPLKRVCGPVVGCDEVIDVTAELARAGEAGPCQRLALQNGKPDFHLIHPGCVCGREMEMDVLVPGQPTIAFGLMGIEVVEDHVDLAAGMFRYDAVHEVEKLHAAAALVMIALHQSGGQLQSRKQSGGAVPLVVMLKAGERLAVR